MGQNRELQSYNSASLLSARSNGTNFNSENERALSAIDCSSYVVTYQFTFGQFNNVSIAALDQILFNMLNSTQEISSAEVGHLVQECQLNRLDLTTSKMLPIVSTMLIQAEIEGIVVKNTRDQVQANVSTFLNWCFKVGEIPFPASGNTFAKFVNESKDRVKPNTMKSYEWAIRKVHVSGGLPDPTKLRSSIAALKSYYNHRLDVWRDSVDQADPMRIEHIKDLFSHYAQTYKSNSLQCRNLLILLISYDTLLREAEIARIRVSDIVERDGVTTIAVNYTKTNRGARVEFRPISNLTISVLDLYLKQTSRHRDTISPLFLPHVRSGRPSAESIKMIQELGDIRKGRRRGKKGDDFIPPEYFITPKSIYRVFVKASEILDLFGHQVALSGHSGRVGKAKDLNALEWTLQQIAQAGGWRDMKTLLGYIEDNTLTTREISQANNEFANEIVNPGE